VYDEFSGGIKSATAIRRYMKHSYLSWTPRASFVTLLGDASMDYRHDLLTSSVDWIPTYLAFESVAGPTGAELVANDSRYVLNLGGTPGGTAAFTPSMLLGRVPSSSASELE